MSSSITFDKFFNIVDGKQRGGDAHRNGVNPATKEKLWDVRLPTAMSAERA
jgi:hypothetical protein